MQQWMQFLSENYGLVFMLGVGILMTQQRFPLAHLILGAKYITAAEAVDLLKQSTVLDLRGHEQYSEEHIKNASHFSGNNYAVKSQATYLLYGDDNTSYTRHLLTLKKLGITNIQIIIGGFSACKEAGLPLETKRK